MVIEDKIVDRIKKETLHAVVHRVRLWERLMTLNAKKYLSPEEQEEEYYIQYKLEELTKN